MEGLEPVECSSLIRLVWHAGKNELLLVHRATLEQVVVGQSEEVATPWLPANLPGQAFV